MRAPGKIVVDEFYVHLSALSDVTQEFVRTRIEQVVGALPDEAGLQPNVAKVNLRTGRLSLLAYKDFFDAPFPQLEAAWLYPPSATSPASFRRYDDSLNPPILHRKELLITAQSECYERWAALTKTAEELGLFDEPATIGFRLNWNRLIASKGYELVADQFVPLGNAVSFAGIDELVDTSTPVQRHLTALSRTAISAPVQQLLRHGLLASDQSFFDYGCGKGGDVSALVCQGFDAKGWDPHYAPDAPVSSADVVNLGFVINVIEDPAERIEALTNAFHLARTVLSVGVMLYGSEQPGRPFRDGFLTARNTFQKYFSQAEIRDYLEHTLHRSVYMVAPGVAFIFSNTDAEQRFVSGRYRSKSLAPRLLATRTRVPKIHSPLTPGASDGREARIRAKNKRQLEEEAVRPLLDELWALALELGRYPELEEVPNLAEVEQRVGSLARAQRRISQRYDLSVLRSAETVRANEIRLMLAVQQFAKRPAFRTLEPRLQRDIKAFFGDYKTAQDAGLNLLIDAADPSKIFDACTDAASRGIGYLDGEHSLQLHVSMVERLPAVLRAFVACGLILWDAMSDVQLVKIHIRSGKLTLLEFDDFDTSPLPLLRRRIKVQVRRLDYDVFEYGSAEYPKPLLYRKSRYLNEDYPGYAEQLAFDEVLERTGVLPDDAEGPPAHALVEMLEARRLVVSGFRLLPSSTIPHLDSPCGANFTYRHFIECGETQRRLGIDNRPSRPETYNALYELAVNVLDPLIEYFGPIRLTYGFASQALTKHIGSKIAPKIDQHASCEHNVRGVAICDRGGAACDFLVEDENMREVADWIIEHLAFDRLYYYGIDRPLHISLGPDRTREAYAMLRTETGRLIPRRMK